jgi:hypothetical protein
VGRLIHHFRVLDFCHTISFLKQYKQWI